MFGRETSHRASGGGLTRGRLWLPRSLPYTTILKTAMISRGSCALEMGIVDTVK